MVIGHPQLPAGTQVNSFPLLCSVLHQGESHITEEGSKGREEAEHSRWAKQEGDVQGGRLKEKITGFEFAVPEAPQAGPGEFGSHPPPAYPPRISSTCPLKENK